MKNLCKAFHKFFNESKQLLGLGKCQSNNFDAQIADVTITMVQHILLTLRYRIENYESMEGLFSQIKEATIKQRLNQRLSGLFIELMQILESVFREIDGQDLFERIFQDPKAFGQLARLLNDTDIAEAA